MPHGSFAKLVAAVVTIAIASPAQGITPKVRTELVKGGRVTQLRDQLEKGLRARKQEEFDFIEKVLDLVENGKLPATLVRATMGYARRKAKRKYPFPYFERALRLRAARLGVTIS
jgi:hypothetical protein